MSKKIFAMSMLCVFIVSLFGLCGCETFKGAADGFKRDWQIVNKWDAWFQKNYW